MQTWRPQKCPVVHMTKVGMRTARLDRRQGCATVTAEKCTSAPCLWCNGKGRHEASLALKGANAAAQLPAIAEAVRHVHHELLALARVSNDGERGFLVAVRTRELLLVAVLGTATAAGAGNGPRHLAWVRKATGKGLVCARRQAHCLFVHPPLGETLAWPRIESPKVLGCHASAPKCGKQKSCNAHQG